jgi:hypothetical protein
MLGRGSEDKGEQGRTRENKEWWPRDPGKRGAEEVGEEMGEGEA